MNVFVVITEPDHETTIVEGVYSTQKLADEALASIDTSIHRLPPEVMHFPLDAPPAERER